MCNGKMLGELHSEVHPKEYNRNMDVGSRGLIGMLIPPEDLLQKMKLLSYSPE